MAWVWSQAPEPYRTVSLPHSSVSVFLAAESAFMSQGSAISGAEHNPSIRDRKKLRFARDILFGNRWLVNEMIANCRDFVTAGSLPELVDKMKAITVPTLIMTGDEDWPCLEPGILMKKNISTAALVVMPNAGHNINLEDPAGFNAHLSELFAAADAGTWPVRDPRAMAGSILGK